MKKDVKVVGWREWVGLHELNIPYIKAKLDTGARTSSLHAYDVEYFKKRGTEYVRFKVHPMQRNTKLSVDAVAKVHEFRQIKSSTGHKSKRPVIITVMEYMGEKWEIELTLANRDDMGFRMLLGREGIRGRVLVDSDRSFHGGQPKLRKVKRK